MVVIGGGNRREVGSPLDPSSSIGRHVPTATRPAATADTATTPPLLLLQFIIHSLFYIALMVSQTTLIWLHNTPVSRARPQRASCTPLAPVRW